MPERDSRDVASVLLEKASEDETALREFTDNPAVSDRILGFHAQQAVEKSFKAVLAFHDIAYDWSHDIGYLIELLEAQGVGLSDAVREAETLTPWATEFRYEDPPTTEGLDRAAALATVVAVREWASGLIVGG